MPAIIDRPAAPRSAHASWVHQRLQPGRWPSASSPWGASPTGTASSASSCSGLVTFTLASLACGFAPTIDWLDRVPRRPGHRRRRHCCTISLPIVHGRLPQAPAAAWPSASGAPSARRRRPSARRSAACSSTYGHWLVDLLRQRPHRRRSPSSAALWILPSGGQARGTQGGLDFPGIVISGVGLFMPHPGARAGQRVGLDLGGRRRPASWPPPSRFPLFIWWEHADRVADVPREPAAHPLVHGRQLRHLVHRCWPWAAPCSHGRHLPGVGARVLRAARRDGADGDAHHRPDRRPQRRTAQRPHRPADAGRGRGGCSSASASSCWPSSAASTTLLGRDVARRLPRRRHGTRHADAVRGCHGLAAGRGARRRARAR